MQKNVTTTLWLLNLDLDLKMNLRE